MIELYESCKKLVLDNYTGRIDENSFDAMVIAVMALCLRNEKRTLEKLPSILQDIVIFAEEDTALNIAKKNINSFNERAIDDNIGACVVSGFYKDDDTDEIGEDMALIVSTINFRQNPVDVIMKIVHELTHLLRKKDREVVGNSIKIKNGISVVRVKDFTIGEKKTKHFYFEEGIVQRYTYQSLDMLYSFIENENVNNFRLLNKFKKDYPSKVCLAYEAQVRLINFLCNDIRFDELVDASFDEDYFPARLVTYFNDKMNDTTAFTNLSKCFDNCFFELDSGNQDGLEKNYKTAFVMATYFLNRCKAKIKIDN